MEKETKKMIGSGTLAELSQLKASAADVLAKEPGRADAQEIVDAVNAELECRSEAEKKPKRVKVRALQFTLVDGKPWEKDREGEVSEADYAANACCFKRLAAFVVLASLSLLLSATPARAQQYTADALNVTNSVMNQTNLTALDGSAGTNCTVPADTIATYKTIIPATKYGDLGLTVAFKLLSSGTYNVGINISVSGDCINWTALPQVQWPASGTTVSTFTTNITLGNIGYIRLDSVTNGTVIMTNLLAKVPRKASRFGS